MHLEELKILAGYNSTRAVGVEGGAVGLKAMDFVLLGRIDPLATATRRRLRDGQDICSSY